MKILLIHNYYRYWGGEDNYFESLKELLKNKGHIVMTYTKKSNEISTLADKIKVVLNMFYNRIVERELKKIIEKYRPDIAQIQNIFPMITPSVYRVLNAYRVPIIQRISNYRLINQSGYHNSLIASLILRLSLFWHRINSNFDKINVYLFPTELLRDNYIRQLKLPKSKTAVIPTFSTEIFSNSEPKRQNYFLYVGRLSEEKGILPLLKLFTELSEIKLIVIGTGPLKKQIEEYKKYRNISFKGYLTKEKLYFFYKTAIATVVPSIVDDIMPNVVLESFYNKTPVIAPSRGIFNKLIRNRFNGLLYKPDDYEDLKNLIKFAINNKARMLKMGHNAKETYNKKYSKKIIYSKLVNLYKTLIKWKA